VVQIQEPSQDEDIVIRDTFSTSSGQVVLEILKRDYYNRPDYNSKEPQPFHTFFRSGQRDVVGFIIEAVERGDALRNEVKVKKNL
jgi:hypothetical protein